MVIVDKWSTDLFLKFLLSHLLAIWSVLFPRKIAVRQPYRSTPITAGDSMTFPMQLATVLGTNEALILQKFHEWIEYNEWAQKVDHFIDGRWWTYNTYAEWQEKHFTWLSVSSVKRICKKLEATGVLVTGRHAKSATDQTKWYSIDYQKLSAMLSDGVSKRVSSADQKSLMVGSKESIDSNRETANKSLKPQKTKHHHQQRTRATTVDGDDFTHDSGEEVFSQKPAEGHQPIHENVTHEADAPKALTPSSAAPLPQSVKRLVVDHDLDETVAGEYVALYGSDECERAADAVLKAKNAHTPAGLWRTHMVNRRYKNVPQWLVERDRYVIK